jgi:hypothetical protein
MRRVIVVLPDGSAYRSGEEVPETVIAAIASLRERRLSLAEALGPTPEQLEERKRRFAEFLASKAALAAEEG